MNKILKPPALSTSFLKREKGERFENILNISEEDRLLLFRF